MKIGGSGQSSVGSPQSAGGRRQGTGDRGEGSKGGKGNGPVFSLQLARGKGGSRQ